MPSFDGKLEEVDRFIKQKWYDECIPTLKEYIKIPNLSPYFDPNVHTNRYMEQAMEVLRSWVEKQKLEGTTIEMCQETGRTPLLFIEIKPKNVKLSETGTVLLYGHMDKQPPFEGWRKGLGPYKPIIEDGKLFGRGGADDGYSCFAAITAIKALQVHGLSHARSLILIEASEESSSCDLPFYIEKLKVRIGSPNLIICLDSGCGNYDQLWITTSLRGCLAGELTVEVLQEGVHSGNASGIVPDSFRIARLLLSRLEDENTGEIKPKEFYCEIPPKRRQLAYTAAELIGENLVKDFPFCDGVAPVETKGIGELGLNKWWKPQLTIIGASEFPPADKAGNVLRPKSTLGLSLRLPPLLEASVAKDALVKLLTTNPPYNAKVSVKIRKAGSGWAAPVVSSWLENGANKASQQFYGKDAVYTSEGGSIAFMRMLGDMFPYAQFLVVGVLGPSSNAHGPNEFLHLEFSRKLTGCISSILFTHSCANVEEMSVKTQDSSKRQKLESNHD